MQLETESLDATMMTYIKRVFGAVCGPHNSRLLYYRNTHPSWTIKIIIDHWWEYNGKEYHEEKERILKPNPNGNLEVVSPLDELMGCPIPGPTMQQFHWDVVNAVRVAV